MQGAVSDYRGGPCRLRAAERAAGTGDTYWGHDVQSSRLCTRYLHKLQDVSQEMVQQLQHIQHAKQNLTAEELRYSTFQLLQAFKVHCLACWFPSSTPICRAILYVLLRRTLRLRPKSVLYTQPDHLPCSTCWHTLIRYGTWHFKHIAASIDDVILVFLRPF